MERGSAKMGAPTMMMMMMMMMVMMMMMMMMMMMNKAHGTPNINALGV